MGSLWALLCLLLAASATANTDATESSPQQHFVVVAPRRLLAGKLEKIWVSLPGEKNSKKIPITINLLNPETSEILSSVIYKYSANVHDTHLAVPTSYLGRATLQVVVGSGTHEVKYTADVDLEHNEALTFIETDRPFYKPGELVRMRFLLLQHKLQPVTDGINMVWVENPLKVRMAQWQNLQTYNGLAQVEMQLSEEPFQGSWNIKLQASNISSVITKSFLVKEYTLPKFEVTITPPEYITINSEDLTWNVCAKYSYGKPVQGHVTFTIKFKSVYNYWYRVRHGSNDEITYNEELNQKDGCYKFHLKKEELINLNERHAFSIEVQATIKEAGTEEVQTAAHTSDIHREQLQVKFINNAPYFRSYFRPYLPYYGKLLVSLRNGKPVGGKDVKLVLKFKKTSHSPWVHSYNLPHQDAKNFTSDANGFINFIIPPQTKEVHTIVVEAYAEENLFELFEIKQWYSPSDSYLQIIEHSNQPLKCGNNHALSIMYTYERNSTKNIKFVYLVQSKGDILKQVTSEENVREFKIRPELRTSKTNITLGKLPAQDKILPIGKWNLKLEMSASMAPQSQLLIYYVKDDGEIVAASHTLNIKKCLKHKVKTRFSHEQVQPGAKVTLAVTPESRSFCAISAVDKAVTFLTGDNALTIDKVFEQLKRFDIGPTPHGGTYHPCFREQPVDMLPVPLPLQARSRRKRMVIPHFTSDYGNTKQAFSDAGLVIISNLEVNPSPCLSDNPDKKGPCNPCPLAFAKTSESRRSMAPNGFAPIGFGDTSLFPGVGQQRADLSRQFIPHAQASGGGYDTTSIDSPIVEIRSLFPETWLWNLEQFDGPEEKEFDLETPHSITDWVVNTVCVSVADGLGIAPPISLRVFKPYFMDFTLPYSVKRGEILPLKVSLFNYLNHDLPVRLTFGDFTGGSLLSEVTHSACLGEHSSLVHEFRLQPTELGEHNITVTANVDPDYPSACGPEFLMDARDGLVKKIIVKPEGFPEEVTNSVFVCLSEDGEQATISWDFNLPENLVEDSARSFVSVIGDIMGPSLENLDGLVQLPMGCGEQNMLLFVPNILVLNYLNSSGQNNPQLSSKALSHMKKGYQRELTYRHLDGSYSAFGMHDFEGSMWLTAFVVKSFAQASKYIFVDTNDLKLSTSWIIRKQMENGCFPFVGKVFHKDMKGGLGEDSSTTALTAYILISLMETGLEINQKVISNGVYCLFGRNETDLYTLTLSTYALAIIHEKYESLVSKEKIERNLELLMSHAITENNEMRFEKKDSKSLAINLEITAYVILILTRLGGEDNLLLALNAVRWISTHRNANGGFVSTQDTVVALEALAKYAVSVPNHNISMQLLATTSLEDWQNEFSLDANNRMVLQQATLSSVPPTISFLAKGHGCALIQSNLRYNVKNAHLNDAFNLTTNVKPLNGNSCTKLLIKASIVYNLEDGESNMVVVEFDMLSGYVPNKPSLEQLKADRAVNLKRWDETNGKLNLYFDSLLTRNMLNLSFVIEQAVEVENPKPAQVRVFDYYTPELTVSTSYGLDDIKCFVERLPEPIAIDETSALLSAPKSMNASGISETDAADEPDGNQTPKDPFENFSNVDHDLEFPEGNEGVEPVYVPAPLLAGSQLNTGENNISSPQSASCPMCHTDVQHTEFSSLYCSAATVLKLSARSFKNAKLLSDVSPNKRFLRMNKNISLTVDKNCECDILNKEGSHVLVLLSTRSDLSQKSPMKPNLHLEQGTSIISLNTSSNKITSALLHQAKRLC